MKYSYNELRCPGCKNIFPIKNGIPYFWLDREKDKYDNAKMVDFYTGALAFGKEILKQDGAESLYQAIDIIFNWIKNRKQILSLLDIGCGIGRTTKDFAENLPEGFIIGLEASPLMIDRAKNIVQYKKKFELDLSFYGWGRKKIKGYGLQNVFFIQGNSLELPFSDETFDCVANIYLVNRIKNPYKSLAESIRVIKKRGFLIFADPLDWLPENFNTEKMIGHIYFNSRDQILNELRKYGLKTKVVFDGLIWKQIHQAWGNNTDWKSLIVVGEKD